MTSDRWDINRLGDINLLMANKDRELNNLHKPVGWARNRAPSGGAFWPIPQEQSKLQVI
ncbi:MAG: hypothetical protein ABI180_13455 [Microcoleus sp.]|jgi:hypothetical protein